MFCLYPSNCVDDLKEFELLCSTALKQECWLFRSKELRFLPVLSKYNPLTHRLVLGTSVSLLCVITKLHIAGWILGKVETSTAIFSHSAKAPVNIYFSVSFRSCLLLWWFGEHSRSVGSCGPFLKGVAQTFEYCNALQSGWCFVLMAVDYLLKKIIAENRISVQIVFDPSHFANETTKVRRDIQK